MCLYSAALSADKTARIDADDNASVAVTPTKKDNHCRKLEDVIAKKNDEIKALKQELIQTQKDLLHARRAGAGNGGGAPPRERVERPRDRDRTRDRDRRRDRTPPLRREESRDRDRDRRDRGKKPRH